MTREQTTLEHIARGAYARKGIKKYTVGKVVKVHRVEMPAHNELNETIIQYAPSEASAYMIMNMRIYDEDGNKVPKRVMATVHSLVGEEAPPFYCDIAVRYFKLPSENTSERSQQRN